MDTPTFFPSDKAHEIAAELELKDGDPWRYIVPEIRGPFTYIEAWDDEGYFIGYM